MNKVRWEKPITKIQVFDANESVATCWTIECDGSDHGGYIYRDLNNNHSFWYRDSNGRSHQSTDERIEMNNHRHSGTGWSGTSYTVKSNEMPATPELLPGYDSEKGCTQRHEYDEPILIFEVRGEWHVAKNGSGWQEHVNKS